MGMLSTFCSSGAREPPELPGRAVASKPGVVVWYFNGVQFQITVERSVVEDEQGDKDTKISMKKQMKMKMEMKNVMMIIMMTLAVMSKEMRFHLIRRVVKI